MRVLIDYRAALRNPSGVGEYVRRLVSSLAGLAAAAPDLTIFSSSWNDRLTVPTELSSVKATDLRIPVSLLNFAWHRLGWPSAESLTGAAFDVTHSLHPLILPSRAAAHVVTIHDLDFLAHPERTRAEIRRDYPPLARTHAHRADRIIVPSRFTAGQVEQKLGISTAQISVCSPGAPDWRPRASSPPNGYALFLGTLEPRKNVGALLDAYERLLELEGPAEPRHDDSPRPVPELVLAGSRTPDSAPWLERLSRAPLAGRVRHVGYVDPGDRRALYEGARFLVQPSLEEGFGLPALEAMTAGVPVVAANRGALPEVVGDAGLLVDPDDTLGLAVAMTRLIDDDDLAAACAAKGVARAGRFRWSATAERVVEAYRLAIDHRTARRRPN